MARKVLVSSFPVHLWLTIEEQSRLVGLTISAQATRRVCLLSQSINRDSDKQWDLLELSGPAWRDCFDSVKQRLGRLAVYPTLTLGSAGQTALLTIAKWTT